MRYFHNQRIPAVYAVQDPPSVDTRRETKTKRRKHPKRLGCTVSARISITRADNYETADGRWAFPTSDIKVGHYDDRDSDADAARMFRSLHLSGFGDEISFEEYEPLRQKYDAQAKANKPPR